MIIVLDPGFYTSVQDLGRLKYTELGVPISGCMDRNSALNANRLIGNAEDAAVLECTMKGPVLNFTEPTFIALCGAEMEVYLDEKLLENGQAYKVNAGQQLKFGKLHRGIRTYMAVAGGIQSKIVLDSRSYFFPVTEQSRIQAGDRLYHRSQPDRPHLAEINLEVLKTPLEVKVLEAWRGPEFEVLPEKIRGQLQNNKWVVSNQNNRMAYQFSSALEVFSYSAITRPVLPGTIQYTPMGSLFALMRDGQTTGGYLRVLQLTEKSVDRLSQMRAGHEFNIALVDVQELNNWNSTT